MNTPIFLINRLELVKEWLKERQPISYIIKEGKKILQGYKV